MTTAIDQAKEILTNTVKRFYWINERLKQIADELKEVQPNKPGAITMSLNGCGKNCLGCPHIAWLSWHASNSPRLKGKYIAKKITSPLRSARYQKDDFAQCNQTVKELISEAIALEKERSSIIKSIDALKTAVKSTESLV